MTTTRTLISDDGHTAVYRVAVYGVVVGTDVVAYAPVDVPPPPPEAPAVSGGTVIVPEPNGVTDTAIIATALASAVAAGKDLSFPPRRTYTLTPTANAQSLISITASITVDLNGSTLKVGTNPYPKVNLIAISGGARVTIRNGKIMGDRTTHDYATTAGTHEFGYGIYVADASVAVEDVEASDFTGDAACIIGDSTCTARFTRLHAHHCRRQGISILAYGRVLVDDCHIHGIGTSDGIAGAAPMAGIDVEPASRTMTVDQVTVRDTRINCPIKSIVTSHTLTSLLVDGCTLTGQVLHTATGAGTFRDTSVTWPYVDQYAVPTMGTARASGCNIRSSRWQIDGPMRDCTIAPLSDGWIPRLTIAATATLDAVTIDPGYTVTDQRTPPA